MNTSTHDGAGRSPDWRDESWTSRFPTLSTAERDRRLALARHVMEGRDLQALVLASPTQSHDFVGHYFANEATPAVVVPRAGDPVAFQDGVTSPTARHDLTLAAERFGQRWIDDWRINEGARGIADLVEELGLADARIGCIGLSAVWPTSSHIVNGGAPWNTLPLTHRLSSCLPAVEWVDVWPELLPRIAVKSAEEIEQFKKASHLADRAATIFYDSLRIGGTTADAMAAAAFDIIRHGGYTPAAGTAFAPRSPLEAGDRLMSELIVYVGNVEAQAGLTAAIGSPSPSMSRLIDAAHESYDIGLATVRPGVTMAELDEAMTVPFRRIGAWSTPPKFHGVNPIFTQGQVGRVDEADVPDLRTRFFPDHEGELPYKPVFGPDTTIEAGMTIHLEPNGQKGDDLVFLGSGVLVTDNGAEEYGDSGRAHVHRP